MVEETSPPVKPFRQRIVLYLLDAWRRWVYVGVLVQLLALCLRSYFWWADLLSHFALFAACVVALTWAVECLRRHKLHAGLLGAALLALLFFVGSYLQRAAVDDAAEADLRVMAFNVLTSNTSHAAVLDELERLSPDVVAVIEVDSTWIKALQPLADRYPHRIELPRSDNFGIACYSRFPLRPIGNQRLLGVPAIDAYVEIPGQKQVRFMAVHTLPPMNQVNWQITRDMVSEVVERVNDGEPTVVCGDFNATPTSAIWQDLLAKDRLLPAGWGRAFSSTWGLRSLPLLQLDHVFVAGPLTVTEDGLGNFAGSDHKPVITGLRIQ